MKKAIFNKTGMKMLVNTGLKTFDKQTNLISTGNVYANTQMSSYIRAFSNTECNGKEFSCGELMRYDLKPFSPFDIPIPIMDDLENVKRTESFILYMFYITQNKQIKLLGWVLTDKDYHLKKWLVNTWTQKREMALREIIKYITI